VVDELRLRDGTRLLVRPIRPEDAGALVAMHARLSKDTIYRRYFGARPRLSPAEVDRFTRLPEPWRFALVAVREPAELVAVARYEGSEGGHTAEIAIVVDDALQRQGVGRALFHRLAEVARANGLTTLVADVLDDNRSMLDLLRTAGLPTRTEREPGARTVFVDLAALVLTGDAAQRAAGHVAARAAATPSPSG
jgi:GNAT superfamily N-acetyltransferase